MQAERYIHNTLLKNLHKWTIPTEGGVTDVRRLGISHATMSFYKPDKYSYDPTDTSKFANRDEGPAGEGAFGGVKIGRGAEERGSSRDRAERRRSTKTKSTSENAKELDRTYFVVEFAWKPTPISKRVKDDPLAGKAAAPAAAPGGEATPTANPPAVTK
jgi:hypothetical protein